MKKKKLNLDELKVKSFVTKLDRSKGETAKGGYPLWPSLYRTGCGSCEECDC